MDRMKTKVDGLNNSDASASISSTASVSVSPLEITCHGHQIPLSTQRDDFFFLLQTFRFFLIYSILLRCIHRREKLLANSELNFMHLWEIGRRHNRRPRRCMPPADLLVLLLEMKRMLQHWMMRLLEVFAAATAQFKWMEIQPDILLPAIIISIPRALTYQTCIVRWRNLRPT